MLEQGRLRQNSNLFAEVTKEVWECPEVILFMKSVWKSAEATAVTGSRPGWFCPEEGRYVLVYHLVFFFFLFYF